MERPRCERKGTVRHPAAFALTWDLLSGRVTRFFCAEHSKDRYPAAISHLQIDWLLRAGESCD